MESFTDLDARQKGIPLAKEVHLLTIKLLPEEQYGLITQIRRAAMGFLAHVADGFSQAAFADKVHKYTASRGECPEGKALLLVYEELEFLRGEDMSKAEILTDETGKLLSGLTQKFSDSQPQLSP